MAPYLYLQESSNHADFLMPRMIPMKEKRPPASPPANDLHNALTEAGKAWKRVKDYDKRRWNDWTMVIGPGLVKAKAEATRLAGRPDGGGYNRAMAQLLEEYGLDDMAKSSRADAIKCSENLGAVEEWLLQQPNRDALNHPTTVWRGYQKSAKQQDEKDAAKAESKSARDKKEHAALRDELERALDEIEQLKAHIEDLHAEIAQLKAEVEKHKVEADWQKRTARMAAGQAQQKKARRKTQEQAASEE